MRFGTKELKTLLLRLFLAEIAFAIIIFIFNNIIDPNTLNYYFPFLEGLSSEHRFHIATIIDLLLLILIFAHFVISHAYKINSLKVILKEDESERLEFKSSLRWDYRKGTVNKDLEDVVAKIIVGFLNTKGGILLIGITDDKAVLGIEKDIETLPKKSKDSFLRHFTQILNEKIGINYARFIKVSLIKHQKKNICLVDVSPSLEPAYLKKNDNDEFYIRVEALTRALKLSEAVKYIEMHWA